jgi:hypothetical protein
MTLTIELDDAIAFFRVYLAKEAAACTAWHLGESAAIDEARALLHVPERGLPFKRYITPQPWGSGARLGVTPELAAKERAALAELPYTPRVLFAVERRAMKDAGTIAFAYVGPQRVRGMAPYYSMRLAAAVFDGRPLLCQIAQASDKSWVSPQGLELKGAGKLVDGRRFEEPPAHDGFHASWLKVPG